MARGNSMFEESKHQPEAAPVNLNNVNFRPLDLEHPDKYLPADYLYSDKFAVINP